MKKYIILVLVLGIVGYLFLKPPTPIEVNWATVVNSPISEYIEEEGKTQLDEDVKIFPTLAGYLGPVQCDVGDIVKAGQPLAQIDPFTQKQEIAALEAEIKAIQHRMDGLKQSKPKKADYTRSQLLLTQAQSQIQVIEKQILTLEVQLEQTRRDYVRVQALITQNISTTQDFDSIATRYRLEQENLSKAHIELEIAKQNQEIAKSNIHLLEEAEDDQEFLREVYRQEIAGLQTKIAVAENDMRKSSLLSPCDGVILERITRGNVYLSFVTPDYYILRIGNLSTIEIRVDILSDDIHKVKVGQLAWVYGPAIGAQKLIGKVAKVYPTAFTKLSSLGIEQQRVIVIIEIPKNILTLYPGYRVDVRIFTKEVSQTLVVPNRAVFSLGGKKHCFVIENNIAKLKTLSIGIETADEIEILEGLAPGQIIVVDPPNTLKVGSIVQQVDSKAR